MSYIIRPLKIEDQEFLWEMLYQALYTPPGVKPLPKEIIYQPELAKYVREWEKKESDLGFIALTEDGKISVGAIWIRLFTKSDRGYGYINDRTPELSIAVLPEYRGRGIGTLLLDRLLQEVREIYPAISLSVSQILHLSDREEE